MNERKLRSKWFIIGILSLLFSFPVFLKAQNYNYQDSTKTDSTKTDSTRTDTVGYYNINSADNYAYALNNSSAYLQDSTMNDTTKTDTTKTDTLGYNNSKDNAYAYNVNLNSGLFLQDSSMTDTSKTDTTKTDTVGYLGSNSKVLMGNSYAFNINIHSLYLQDSTSTDTSRGGGKWDSDSTKTDTVHTYQGSLSSPYNLGKRLYASTGSFRNYMYLQDSSMTDTSETDTTKSDTVGYRHSDKAYAYNENINSNFSFKNESGSLIVNNLWRKIS